MLVSFGQMLTALVAAADSASAVMSAVVPMLFLFGGLLITYPNIPVWWRWMYRCALAEGPGRLFPRRASIVTDTLSRARLDPLSYALSSLAAPQFARHGCSGAYPGGDCPTVSVLSASGPTEMDKQAYVEKAFGIVYTDRWKHLGYLAVFAAGFQALHFAATRALMHSTR